MTDYAPIINDYKLKFARRRLLESLLGGVRLVASYSIPWSLRVLQILVFLLPAVVGVALTLAMPSTEIVPEMITGGVLVVVVAVLAALSEWMHRRESLDDDFGGNVANDEEDFDFDSFLCLDTFRFLCPRRHPLFILFKLLLAFCLGAGAAYVLNVARVEAAFPTTAPVVIAFAWFSVCYSYFPLAAHAPPDPAQFRLTEFGLAQGAVLSAGYLAAAFGAVFLTSLASPENQAVVSMGVLLFAVLLPWLRQLGMVPQLDAALSWLFEQIHVYMLGGSHSGTDARLVVMVAASAAAVGVAYAVHVASNLTIVVLLVVAFLASFLAHNPYWTVVGRRGKRSKVGVVSDDTPPAQARPAPARSHTLPPIRSSPEPRLPSSTAWGQDPHMLNGDIDDIMDSVDGRRIDIPTPSRPPLHHEATVIRAGAAEEERPRVVERRGGIVPFVFGLVASALAGAAALLLSMFAVSLDAAAASTARLVVTVVWAVVVVVAQLHRPYLCRVLRNPLFRPGPPALVPSWIRRVGVTALTWGTVALILLDPGWLPSAYFHAALMLMLLFRALRHAIQSPIKASAELAFSGWLGAVWPWWAGLGLGWQLVLAALVGDRALDWLAKMEFALTLLVTSVTEKKARFRHRIAFVAVISILFPITILFPVTFSAALSTSLLPMMGLPLFFPAFPRPLRAWASAAQTVSSGPDAAYYRHMSRALSNTLGPHIASGRLGEVEEGGIFLLRHEKQSAWVQVIERGARHVWLSVRGLELAETSCHHLEGVGLESVFSQARMDTAEAYQGGMLNRVPFHVMNPMCAVKIRGYSNTVMSLVGIIDQPSIAKDLSDTFFSTLVWCLIKKLGRRGFAVRHAALAAGNGGSVLSPEVPARWRPQPIRSHNRAPIARKFPTAWYSHILGGEGVATQIEAGSDPFVELAIACYGIVEVFGMAGMGSSPDHVVSVFSGSVPPSLESRWLDGLPDLKAIVVTAYTYAVKLQIDSVTIGPVDSHSELADTLDEYDKDWFMGVSDSTGWARAMEISVPNLFEVYRDSESREFKGHLVTLQPIDLQVGRLNPEASRGLWAALNLELLYFTNDDDERYSIQAHPTLLRNMTVQSALPPLGYPCYSDFALVPLPIV